MYQFKNQSPFLAQALTDIYNRLFSRRSEYLTPEHLLLGIAEQPPFREVDPDNSFPWTICKYLNRCALDSVPSDLPYSGPELSVKFVEMANIAYAIQRGADAPQLDVPHIVGAMLKLADTHAYELLMELCDDDPVEFMSNLIEAYANPEYQYSIEPASEPEHPQVEYAPLAPHPQDKPGQQPAESNASDDDDDDDDFSYDRGFFADDEEDSPSDRPEEVWRRYVTCLNDIYMNHNLLVGRAAELDRTILVLSRKDKNNPIHVGEPGVGKTAIAYGLARLIDVGNVPDSLKGCRIYSLDLGGLLAGTQYRGDFEKRIKSVLNGLAGEKGSILYIDEIHNIIGAGEIEGSTLDASNILRPYLEDGSIRFMGATTYSEYKVVEKDKAFSRRFEKIDIPEPTVDQAKGIVRMLDYSYGKFHGVTYAREALEYAVEASVKYITDRFLPDKAIDLIDEAGAWVKLYQDADNKVVTKAIVSQVLAKRCNVEMLADDAVDVTDLGTLKDRILSQIYGQDAAVAEVAEAVEMASAGLADDNKPMASLLFVGPTGVGKTEVAKVLASELHVPLLRFDMSEYAEKHTVAKLIGAPAGYVGYDDGGLLTDAIRKQPHCVLLFDEIEKAHPDIYNILLQVMDYAVLTDNRGQKADFRHVVFILTTNCGAQDARQGAVGFTPTRQRGATMLKSVKQTFRPEFINRLTSVTVFNDMDRTMAELVLDKKLRALSDKLAAKGITLTLEQAARELLMREGFSHEYGGREVERVINSRLKPLLTRAILYGNLSKGGAAVVDVDDDKLVLR